MAKRMKGSSADAAPDFYNKAFQRVGTAAMTTNQDQAEKEHELYEPASQTANHSEPAPVSPKLSASVAASPISRHDAYERPGTSTYQGYEHHFGEGAEYSDDDWETGYTKDPRHQPVQHSCRRFERHSIPASYDIDQSHHHSEYSSGRYNDKLARTTPHSRTEFPQPTYMHRPTNVHPAQSLHPQVSISAGYYEQQSMDGVGRDEAELNVRQGRVQPTENFRRGSTTSMDVDEDNGEDLFVPSESSQNSFSEDNPTPKKRVTRHKSVGRSGNAGRNVRVQLEQPRYNENGRVNKASCKGRGRGRPSAGSVINAPLFEHSQGKLNAQRKLNEELQRINHNRSGNSKSSEHHNANWETQIPSQLVDTAGLSQAAFIKRGLDPGTVPAKACIKERGVNDPENIAIVNMKDQEGLSFDEIAKRINDKRVKNGKNPNMKANAANCRYNRTAPSLYQMRGLTFTRIADRANGDGDITLNQDQQQMIWTAEMDATLAEIENEYRVKKWVLIARRLAAQFPRETWITEKQVATRFTNI